MKSKTTAKRAAKPVRSVFAEVKEGLEALASARKGKVTLRTHTVVFKDAPSLSPEDVIHIRKTLRISRSVFAAYLRTNVRTLENWEQGRAKPNAQAALLINLVQKYPDTVKRLASI